jgi:hypothetical protein
MLFFTILFYLASHRLFFSRLMFYSSASHAVLQPSNPFVLQQAMLFFSHLILLLFSKPCCSSASHVVLQPSNPVTFQQAMLFFSKPCCSSAI